MDDETLARVTLDGLFPSFFLDFSAEGKQWGGSSEFSESQPGLSPNQAFPNQHGPLQDSVIRGMIVCPPFQCHVPFLIDLQAAGGFISNFYPRHASSLNV